MAESILHRKIADIWRQDTNQCLVFEHGLSGTCRCKPTLRVNGKLQYAARLTLEHKLGRKILPGYEACHICDNSKCVNPRHIYEGTHQDNMNDRAERGVNGKQKLTEQDAQDIKWLHSMNVPQRDVASLYNVSPQAVNDVIKCRRFRRLCNV